MENNNDEIYNELLFKYIIIGDSGVGKSCIIYHYIYNKFKVNSEQTIAVDFSSKKIKINNNKIKLQIWDIAGQEKFRCVASNYYRGAIGLILVFDLTKNETFNHIESWLNEAKQYIRKDCCIILVGNKNDLIDNREVDFQDAQNYALNNNMEYIETSCITGNNIKYIFNKLSENICENIKNKNIDKSSLESNFSKILSSKIIKNDNENNSYNYFCC